MIRFNCRCSWLKASFCRLFSIGKERMATLEKLRFDNLALRRLPIDSEERNYVRTVSGACFSKVTPTPVDNPVTIAYSESAMALLDLPVRELERKIFAEYFSGNKLLPGSETAAHCYCGHQFGFFSGQLGDGAAMYLGEVVNNKQERWEIQLKGAGLTPYSRTADGRKVMRSSIREFLCSEAMHFLGIPTTRAGSCVTSDSEVVRDIFYNGNPIKEKCTIVLRIAPTFLRFGSFEIFKTADLMSNRRGPSVGRHDIMHTMLDYVIETFYPEINAAHRSNDQEKYAEFFKELVLRTARLVALWQCVGFCHGVLNTDNMSIVGATIDYGPFGFMDLYNPDHICNGSDNGGRYSYHKQPEMCLWNLTKLAEIIQNLLPLTVSGPLLDLFETEYKSLYLSRMRQKLGLIKKEMADDGKLIKSLLMTMESAGADFTNTFRCLSSLELPGLPNHEDSCNTTKRKLMDQSYPLDVLIKTYKNDSDNKHLRLIMKFVESDQNFSAAIRRSGFHFETIVSRMEKAVKFETMSNEGKKTHDENLWSEWLRKYVDRLKVEIDESIDVKVLEEIQAERVLVMNRTNPKFILRNYIAQNAIAKAETGDYSEVRRVLKLLENPFDDVDDATMRNLCVDVKQESAVSDVNSQPSGSSRSSFVENLRMDGLPPDWAHNLTVT